tara:strand:+ start:351 stop:809 length:459 start_codon:yes stop_codon:yes gene_type:complete
MSSRSRPHDKCWICCKDLSNITSVVQANLINNKKTWREDWEKRPYKFFFPEENKSTCLDCFKTYSAWKSSKNKLQFIRNRQIKGNKPLLKFPVPVKYDKCIICKQKTEYEITTSIYQRQHFLSGIGQFCGPCYMATANTGIVMREFYEDYLF